MKTVGIILPITTMTTNKKIYYKKVKNIVIHYISESKKKIFNSTVHCSNRN